MKILHKFTTYPSQSKIPQIKNDGMFGLLAENALLAEINLILKT